jgi:protein-tyrosine phosphatase
VKILFVCTGNICRSPTAERLAIAYNAHSQAHGDIEVSSAGTRAVIGHPIHHEAAAVLENMGGQSTDFAARQLTFKIASKADLILTMTKAHRDAVLEVAPRQLRRTFTLGEAARLATNYDARNLADLSALRTQLGSHDSDDIPDPIGQDAEVFATVGALIAELVPPVLELCRQQDA